MIHIVQVKINHVEFYFFLVLFIISKRIMIREQLKVDSTLQTKLVVMNQFFLR